MSLMFKTTIIAIICLSLTGCASWLTGKYEAKSISIEFATQNNINRNILGVASPIAIDIYQLSDAADFTNANYQQVTDGKINNVLQQQTVLIRPGKVKTIKLQLSKNATAIGVVANYRVLSNHQWKFSKSIGWFTSSVHIRVNANGLVEYYYG